MRIPSSCGKKLFNATKQYMTNKKNVEDLSKAIRRSAKNPNIGASAREMDRLKQLNSQLDFSKDHLKSQLKTTGKTYGKLTAGGVAGGLAINKIRNRDNAYKEAYDNYGYAFDKQAGVLQAIGEAKRTGQRINKIKKTLGVDKIKKTLGVNKSNTSLAKDMSKAMALGAGAGLGAGIANKAVGNKQATLEVLEAFDKMASVII